MDRPQGEGDDLALIPANAQGFISIRLADLWKTPAAQEALKKGREDGPPQADPAERMERETGLRCIGAPVRDSSASVIAAVSISGPVFRIRRR